LQRIVSRASVTQGKNLRTNGHLVFSDFARQKDRGSYDLRPRPTTDHFESANRCIDYLTVWLYESYRVADTQHRATRFCDRARNKNASAPSDLEGVFDDKEKRGFHTG
jgi:hypothetical protein